jgi:ketosteroid isomerase-like protein
VKSSCRIIAETYSTQHARREFNWNFSAKLRKDGSSVSFRGLETQIYRKNHDRWYLVHVHYSALPAEKKAGTE